jgi:tetratricopeptide (TPR) repeat protein
MYLQAALGLSLMFTRGSSEEARVALDRSLAIAEAHGDAVNQLQLLAPLHMFHVRIADFKAALQYAKRSFAVSGTIGDPGARARAHSLLGISLHLMGDLDGARVELEAALRHEAGAKWTSTLYRGFDHRNWAGIALARTLWLQGHPAQAVERARQTVTDAERMGHPVTLSAALNWAVSVFLCTGDLLSADRYIDRLISQAETHSLAPYLAVGRGYKGDLAIRRGDANAGVESLRGCLEELHAARYELLTTAFNISRVQGLSAIGRFAEGIALIDETVRLVEANGDFSYMPELLRVRGGLHLAKPDVDCQDAETCFLQSLALSRRQGARAWELRTAVDYAALLAARGQGGIARALLQPLRDQFVEGLDTADLKAAERLLATLG